MISKEEALNDIFEKHGRNAVYISPTGYISRIVYDLFPSYDVFYMQGSMGLSPAIGLGLAMSTTKDVVVINGDGAHLMHLGLTHTVRDAALINLFVYILDNGCYESVGGQRCPRLEDGYVGVNKIYKVSVGDKPKNRVGISFYENVKILQEALRC